MEAFWKTDSWYINPEQLGGVWSEQEGSTWSVRVYFGGTGREISAKTGYASQAEAETAIQGLLSDFREP